MGYWNWKAISKNTQRMKAELVAERKSVRTMIEDRKRSVVIRRFKDSILFRLAALNPSFSINSAHSSFIHNRLQHLFHSFDTPTHPPYALMIKKAIMELNEESGSTEEAISDFIRREYEGLPWAHVTILHIHLRKLCLDGDLVCTNARTYLLLVNCDDMRDNGMATD